MTARQRLLFLLAILAVGSIIASTLAVVRSGDIAAWAVFWASIMAGIMSLVFSSADADQEFFGINLRGLRVLRTTGEVVPARVLEVTTRSQDEIGNVFIRLRLDVAPTSARRFITWTAAKIAVTDVPRYQPGKMLPVRFLPQYSGAVTVEPHPTDAQSRRVEAAVWGDAVGLSEFSGRLPKLRPSAARAAASVLAVLATLALGAGISSLIIAAAS